MSEGFQKAQRADVREAGEGRRHHHHDRADPGQAGAEALITAEMVKTMKQGSVIVDMAAEQGGNCELTVPGEAVVVRHGVTIIGYTDLASRLARQSSTLYATTCCG